MVDPASDGGARTIGQEPPDLVWRIVAVLYATVEHLAVLLDVTEAEQPPKASPPLTLRAFAFSFHRPDCHDPFSQFAKRSTQQCSKR